MKQFIVVVLIIIIITGLAGCSGISQEAYNQLKADYDDTIIELNDVKGELDNLQAVTFNSKSLDIVKEKAEKFFKDSVALGYNIGNKEIINVIVILDVNDSEDANDASGFGAVVGTMLATGKIDCDYLYIDLAMSTGKKVYSLMADSAGNMLTASYEDVK